MAYPKTDKITMAKDRIKKGSRAVQSAPESKNFQGRTVRTKRPTDPGLNE